MDRKQNFTENPADDIRADRPEHHAKASTIFREPYRQGFALGNGGAQFSTNYYDWRHV